MARFRKVVYCEVRFLEFLYKKIECNDSFSKTVPYLEMKLWRCINNFLRNTAIELHLDITQEKIDLIYEGMSGIAKRNEDLPVYKDLIQTSVNDTKHVQLEPDHEPLNEMDTQNGRVLNINAIYLTMAAKSLCDELKKRTGTIFISPHNINDFIPLTNDNGEPIHKDDSKTWNKILSKCQKIPCNRITIVDNYLLNNMDTIDSDLVSICEALLPKEFDETFHLSIISAFRNDKGHDLPFEERCDAIKALLESFEKTYPISLNIVKCANKIFHDRTILTNSIWIGSAAGFDMFGKKKKAKHTTVVNIVSPYLNDTIMWAFGAYGHLIQETERIIKNNNCYCELKEKGIKNLNSYPSFKCVEVIRPNPILNQ